MLRGLRVRTRLQCNIPVIWHELDPKSYACQNTEATHNACVVFVHNLKWAMAFTFNSMKVNVTSFTFTWQIRQWSISKFRKGHVKKKYFNKTAIVLYLIHFWYLIHRIKKGSCIHVCLLWKTLVCLVFVSWISSF